MKYILVYVNYDGDTDYVNKNFDSLMSLEAYVLTFYSKFTSFEMIAIRNKRI